jgi:protein phosphatase
MGAVATVAFVQDGTVAIGHVGDSRAYLMRGGGIEQLTKDHSLVAELVESGVLTPEEAEHHPQRSAITRALGTEPAVEVDVFTVAGEPGDVFLLCSDGLSSMVSDEQVAAAVEAADRDPERAAEALVRAANARGGEDNITVVVFELVGATEVVEAAEESSPADDTEHDPASSDTAAAEEPGPESPPAVSAETDPVAVEATRHGAGPGGRIAAIALLAAVLVVAVLAIYTGITR